MSKNKGLLIDLISYLTETHRRKEPIGIYLINRKTKEVINIPLNPFLLCAIIKSGIITDYLVYTKK